MKKIKNNTVVCSVMKNVRIMEGKNRTKRRVEDNELYNLLTKNTVLNTNEPNN